MKNEEITVKAFRYKIIEYEYTKLTSDGYDLAKTVHKTNSKLLMYLIVLIFKIEKIKYKVVKV